MLRMRAVRALLFDEVAGLRRGGARSAAPESAAAASETEERLQQERELDRARRRALVVAVACAAAVVALFVLREPARPWLVPGRGAEGAFAIGVLLVTAYAGFRLAQYLHLRTVARVHRELTEREE